MSILSVSDLVEQHVRTRPDAVAVGSLAPGAPAPLTYRALSRAANRLADRLAALGIGRGDRVVAALRPGADTATALLGIVRSGAAYVLVDPGRTGEERRQVVRASAARAVLAEGADPDGYRGLDIVLIDPATDPEPDDARSEARPGPAAGPDDACCVSFAAAAQVPGGTVLSHRAVLHLVRSGAFGHRSRSGDSAPDPAGIEVWAALADGRTARRPGRQPGTPVQEIVRDLFAEAAGVPRHTVDADSDFFRLGGHTGDAARLRSRVRDIFGTAPGPDALHDAPTPAAYAALVGDTAPATATGPFGAGNDSALLSLRLRGRLHRTALEEALVDLGERHEALRNSRIGWAGTRLRTLADDDHLLALALPADMIDAWSHLPLAADLALAYGARATGADPHRAPAALDTAPRAADGDTAPTMLPGTVPADAGHTYSTLEADLGESLHARLVRCAAERGATVFMVAHAALSALLVRLGADPAAVTVAAPVPARDRDGLRDAVGPYGRVLALTVDVSGAPAFHELLGRVRGVDLTAYRDGSAELARPGGGVSLTVVQEPGGRFEAAGLTVEPVSCDAPVPAVDLALVLTERQTADGAPAGVRLTVQYRRETIGEAAAAALSGQFTAVLEDALADPAVTVGRLRLHPGRPSDGAAWADGALAPATDVPALFAAQVARAPQAPAIRGMSYAELDARSDLLAHALLEHRAGPGSCVLTALTSPAAFAVAAVAVVKTGAALVPVDPSLDLPERLRPVALLLDEVADLVLPAVSGAARLVQDPGEPLPSVGHWPFTDADRFAPLTAQDPVLLAPTDDGTVVIGAAAVTAATLAGPVDSAWLAAGYPDGDCALGLLTTLVTGAEVHVPDGSLAQTVPHELLQWLRQERITALVGGADETLSALLALARTEEVALTVSGGWAEGRLVVQQPAQGPSRPAPGHRAYILDASLRPVGPGETGTLYIAGAGAARAYAGSPAATAERFLPDVLGTGTGATALMWRTGRAARFDADGGLRVLDHPAENDPFADEFATFVVLADGEGREALWPAAVPVPDGWHQTHAEDLYELCLAHISGRQSDPR
jgi:pristinamycin I synthase-3/4